MSGTPLRIALALALFCAVSFYVQTDARTLQQDDGFQCPTSQDNTSTTVYYQNSEDCASFYECTANSTAVLLPCPPSTYFDISKDVCTTEKPTSGCKLLD
uniref:Chitin-binding type-2 domain-containing protein n=1 Tax=Timema poppense TaxID=170557 RepID=A0A7R9GXU1_TIMPO|nr:unnamed protein product [Timema poppensis]